MQTIHARILPELSIESAPSGLRVLAYTLDEALSEPSRLACVFDAGDKVLPKPADLLDKRATFVLRRTEDAQERSFTGVVVACELGPDSDDVPSMRVEVAPSVWDLGQRADCRTFQKLSAVDIVKKVLEGAGIAAERQDWRLGEDHPVRVYTVQYRETDLELVQRLLAEEGIYYVVVDRDGKDVLVFGDAPDGFGDVEGTKTLPFHEAFGGAGAADRIFALERTVSVRTDKVFVRDYDPDRPKLEIEAATESVDPGSHVLEAYDYPARALDVAVAAHRAKVLLQSVQAERDVVHGEAGTLALVPGFRFAVEDHPYDPLNQTYLVIRSRLSGSQPRHFERGGVGGAARASEQKVELWAVPTKTTVYRPARRPRAQTVPGLQTAITTGPPGEEIHTDAGGHVTVLFHWDRLGKADDTSSRWIRTSQLPLGGSMLLPRVGWEVTVCHLEGDCDRPVVMGRVYNAQTPPPYALPKEAGKSSLQTATTPGGGSTNELRMGDSKGGEEIFFNASKDMTTQVKNNLTETIANDKKKKVGSNQKKNVTDSVTSSVGANQTVKVGGNQSIKTETFMVDEITGNHTLTIGGSRDMKVGGDHKRDVGGSSSTKVDGRQVDLVVGSVTHETLASFKHDVGAALVQLSVGNRTVTVGGARSESAGGAKIIAVKGGRGVDVAGSLNLKVGGAIVNVANADRVEGAGGTFTEIAAGAQLVKANNVVFEAQNMLSVVMGASTVTLMPAMVAIAGLSVKLDGDVVDEAALIVDN